MNTLLSIVLLIQYSICVLLYTHGTLVKHLKAYNNMFRWQRVLILVVFVPLKGIIFSVLSLTRVGIFNGTCVHIFLYFF